jgi:hypothetical protein
VVCLQPRQVSASRERCHLPLCTVILSPPFVAVSSSLRRQVLRVQLCRRQDFRASVCRVQLFASSSYLCRHFVVTNLSSFIVRRQVMSLFRLAFFVVFFFAMCLLMFVALIRSCVLLSPNSFRLRSVVCHRHEHFLIC